MVLIKFPKITIWEKDSADESTNQVVPHDVSCAGPHKNVMGVSLLAVTTGSGGQKNQETVTNGLNYVSSFDLSRIILYSGLRQ